jgi:phosphatidylglycerol:prolipoprotein diacylglycerol transferase
VLVGQPAGIWFLHRRHLPILPMADLIAPSMVLGQAIGRIGCFLNGCCYGGVCLTASLGVTFPADSPPYEQQVRQYGWHSGVWLEEQQGKIQIGYVAPGSAAAAAGVQVGQVPIRINGVQVTSLDKARDLLRAARQAFEIETSDESIHRWSIESGPPRSVPVHAAQIYAAIDAGLLALLLWAFYPFRRRDGEVFALLITLHPISRFLLEVIRNDEPGRFGTALTISQWLSLGILAAAGVLWFYIERQPRLGSA